MRCSLIRRIKLKNAKSIGPYQILKYIRQTMDIKLKEQSLNYDLRIYD